MDYLARFLDDWHPLSSTEDLSSVMATIQKQNAELEKEVEVVRPQEQRVGLEN